MRISQTLTAATAYPFQLFGNHFLLESVPDGTVDVDFFKDNRKLDEELRSVVAGWYVFPQDGFDRLVITSTLTQNVQFQVNRGRVGSNVFSGAVSTLNPPVSSNVIADFAPVAVTAALTVLLAAAPARTAFYARNVGANPVALCSDLLGILGYDDAAIVLLPGEIWREANAASAAWYAMCDTGLATTVNLHAQAWA